MPRIKKNQIPSIVPFEVREKLQKLRNFTTVKPMKCNLNLGDKVYSDLVNTGNSGIVVGWWSDNMTLAYFPNSTFKGAAFITGVVSTNLFKLYEKEVEYAKNKEESNTLNSSLYN